VLSQAKIGTYLQHPVLRLNGNDLVPNQLENAVHHRLKALQNLLVCKGHISFFNARFRELSFNANIYGPFLSVIPEIRLDSVLEVHDAFGVDLARRLRPIRELHLPYLCPQNVRKVSIERGGAA